MKMIFKVDGNNTVYLMFCQEIDLVDLNKKDIESKKVRAKNNVFQIPEYINNYNLSNKKPINLNKDFQCMNCEVLLDEFSYFKVDLNMVL